MYTTYTADGKLIKAENHAEMLDKLGLLEEINRDLFEAVERKLVLEREKLLDAMLETGEDRGHELMIQGTSRISTETI